MSNESGSITAQVMQDRQEAVAQVAALSGTQQRVFLMMCEYWSNNDHLPAMEAVSKSLGYKSPNTAYQAVRALEKKGFFVRSEAGRLSFRRVSGVSLGSLFSRGATRFSRK